MNPEIQLNSDINSENLKLTISGINVSIINALRRIILSEIPIIVFKTSPYNNNKCNIITNTCGLTNEIVKHRLSCIPIFIKPDNFDIKNHILEVKVENQTSDILYVTTKDFQIKNLKNDIYLSESELTEIFPPDSITGDYIDFVRLKQSIDGIPNKSIYLTCEFDIGIAKEDAAFNVVSTCSYGNTIDEATQEVKLQQLIQKWKDEKKTEKEIEFDKKNWRLLDGFRYFKPDSFDFEIQSICVYNNIELLINACSIMLMKLNNLNELIDKDELEIKLANVSNPNTFDIILDNEDYTLGKVIEYYLLIKFYETGIINFCGFKKLHPHDNSSIIKVAYPKITEINILKGHLKESINEAIEIFIILRKKFISYVNN